MNKIMITSMLNSGTHFWMNFLKLHPEVSNKVYMAYEDFEKSFRNFQNSQTNNQKMIVQHHLVGDGNFIPAVIGQPTIWTIRDPLAALISISARNPEFTWDSEWWDLFGNRNLKAFCYMIKIYGIANNIMVAPVDLPMNIDQKKNMLRKGLHHMGLSPDENIVNSYGNNWALVNSKGNYPLKNHYNQNNKAELKSIMGPSWNLLTSRESEMRPFLESIGYKNLMWWK